MDNRILKALIKGEEARSVSEAAMLLGYWCGVETGSQEFWYAYKLSKILK